MESTRSTRKKLPSRGALELNFVITKFRTLVPATQRLVYDSTRPESPHGFFVAAGYFLLDLIKTADQKELTEFVNRRLKTSLSGYCLIPELDVTWACLFALHFRLHLTLIDNAPAIEFVEM